MNFHDFFGNIFGFPRYRNPPRRGDDDDDDDEEGEQDFGAFGFHGNLNDDDEDEYDERHGIFSGDPFGGSHQDFFRESEQMFKHFEHHFTEMFKNFGLAEFPPMNIPSIEGPKTEKKSGSLRDEMLKKPTQDNHAESETRTKPFDGQSPLFKEWQFNWPYRLPRSTQPSNEKKDKDLDDAISSGNIDVILPGRHDDHENVRPSTPQRKSFFRSMSVTTVRKPDGSVEERRTVKDEHGNVETTVTTTDRDGIQQPSISSPESQDLPVLITPRHDAVREPTIPDGSKSIFDKLFGR
ncbi:HCLS1-associated protein X-1-like [Glandiceps talaboti]